MLTIGEKFNARITTTNLAELLDPIFRLLITEIMTINLCGYFKSIHSVFQAENVADTRNRVFVEGGQFFTIARCQYLCKTKRNEQSDDVKLKRLLTGRHESAFILSQSRNQRDIVEFLFRNQFSRVSAEERSLSFYVDSRSKR